MSKQNRTPLSELLFTPLYYILTFGSLIYLKLFHKLKITEKEKIKGPAIILCNHPSSVDFLIAAAALLPLKLNFLAAYYYFIISRPASFLLRSFGAIPKFQFSPDVAAMRKISSRLKKQNGIICLMPEGTVYGNGKLGYFNPATAKLIKHFNVPVYIAKIHGAALSFPKWAKKWSNGNLSIEIKPFLDSEKLKLLNTNQINDELRRSLVYDDYKYAETHRIGLSNKYRAEGLENLLMICPNCNSEFSIKTAKNTITCTCGLCAIAMPNATLEWGGANAHFKTIGEWYEFQCEAYKKQIENPLFCISSKADYYSNQSSFGGYVKIGEGTITLNHSGICYVGTENEKEVTIFEPTKNTPALVYDIGKNFELPYNGKIRCFAPEIGASSVKWSICQRLLYDKECLSDTETEQTAHLLLNENKV